MSSVFPPGLQLASRYRVLRLLEDNRIGAVFEAESLTPGERGKRVALKWLRFSSGRAPHLAEQYAELARAASRVRQRAVARIHEVTHEGNAIFVVSELLRGESLRARLAPHTMALHERLNVLVDAMQAVSAVHAQGLVHGGLHPGNIFLHREHDEWVALPPVTKLLDFGISTHGLPESLAHPSERFELGPHVFLDYEQLAADSERDPRSDVYACGVLLYHALTGHVPYPAKTPFELGLKLATTRPPDARTLLPELPVELAELIFASLLRERSERPSLSALSEQTALFAAQRSSREVLGFGGPHTLKMIRPVSRPVAPIPSDRTTLKLHLADFEPATVRVPRAQLASLLAPERTVRADPSHVAPSMLEPVVITMGARETQELAARREATPAPAVLAHVSPPTPALSLPIQARGTSHARALALLALVALVALARVGLPALQRLRGELVRSTPPALPLAPIHLTQVIAQVRSAPTSEAVSVSPPPVLPMERRDAAIVSGARTSRHEHQRSTTTRVERPRRSDNQTLAPRHDDSYLVGTPPTSDEF